MVALLLHDADDAVVRAACDALAGMGSVGLSYADSIATMLNNHKESKRCFAAGALGRMGAGASKYAEQVRGLMKDKDANVRASALVALGNMRCTEDVKEIAKCLSDQSPSVVSGAITALAVLAPESKGHASDVVKKLKDANKDVKSSAVVFMGKYPDQALANVKPICKLLEDPELAVRQSVVDLCASLGDDAAPLAKEASQLLQHQDPKFKAAAAAAIGAVGSAAASCAPSLAAVLQDDSEDKSQEPLCVAGIEYRSPSLMRVPACGAATALAAMKDSSYNDKLMQMLESKNVDIKIAAMLALANLGASCEDALSNLIDASAAPIRAAACRALGILADKVGSDSGMARKVAACMEDQWPSVRVAAIEAVSKMTECSQMTGQFKELFADRCTAVRVAALKGMASAGPKGQCYAPDVCRNIYEEKTEVRLAAIEALSDMGERGAAFADEIAHLLEDHDARIRAAALLALAKMGDAAKPFLDQIEAAKSDYSEMVSEAAAKAHAALTMEAIAE